MLKETTTGTESPAFKHSLNALFPDPIRFPGKKGTKQHHFKYNSRLKIRMPDTRLSDVKRVRAFGYRSILKVAN